MSEESKRHKAIQNLKAKHGEGIQDHPNFNAMVDEEVKGKTVKVKVVKKK